MMIASRMVVTGILFLLVVVVGGICLQIFLSRRRSRWPGLILPVISFLVSLLYLFNLADSGSVVQNILMALVTLLVSKEWLSADDKVLIIDDFMANGEAMRGLCDIVNAAGATLVGIGCAVEKGFQGGGDRLRAAGVNLKSLAIIESAEPGNIVFRGED